MSSDREDYLEHLLVQTYAIAKDENAERVVQHLERHDVKKYKC